MGVGVEGEGEGGGVLGSKKGCKLGRKPEDRQGVVVVQGEENSSFPCRRVHRLGDKGRGKGVARA